MMDAADTTTPPAADPEPVEPDAADIAAEAYLIEKNGRKWLHAIAAVLAQNAQDSGMDRRVQYAFDQTMIAALERATRILRSDLPDDRG